MPAGQYKRTKKHIDFLSKIHMGERNPRYGKIPWNKKKPVKIICIICKKIFYVRPSAKTRKFCSQRCFVQYKKTDPSWGSWNKGRTDFFGKNNPCWKGGKTVNRGYIYILKSEHPFHNCRGYVLKSRLVAEKALGRYLKPTEKVHHINDNPSDNRKKNLYLFNNQNSHCIFHRRVNKGEISLNSLKSNLP